MKKTFIRDNLLSFVSSDRVETAGHRFYRSPESSLLLPSVTTVLKSVNKESLERWKANVGQKQAKKIADAGAERGDHVHHLIEEHLQNKPHDWEELKSKYPGSSVPRLFKQIRQHCDSHVDNIRLQESTLYSDTLGTAGAVDLVADYDGELCIIDFKTATSIKNEETVYSYKLQVALYGLMFMEMYQMPITRAIILIGCEKTPVAQVFDINLEEYFKPANSIIKKYYADHAEFITKVRTKHGAQ